MKRLYVIFLVLVLAVAVAIPSTFAADEMAKKLNTALIGLSKGNWQVKADELNKWMQEKRTDFLVVDVRPDPKEYKEGHIPGAIYIPFNAILKPENLKKLPKDKKIVLACDTGQAENLPIVSLRALGYNAYNLFYGYTSWIKGSLGSHLANQVIQGAATKNYPIAK